MKVNQYKKKIECQHYAKQETQRTRVKHTTIKTNRYKITDDSVLVISCYTAIVERGN